MDAQSFEIDYRGINANIAQIQVLAAVIKKMVQDEFDDKNSHLLASLPLPTSFRDWSALNNYCREHKNMESFRILSDFSGSSEYAYKIQDHSQPSADIYLCLSTLQDTFAQLEKLNLETTPATDIHRLTQNLTNAYMHLNNGIGNFFFNTAYESGTFSWNNKLYPGEINLDWMRDLNGSGMIVACSKNKKIFQRVFRTRLEELACQCRFMAFWSCLMQIITFPLLQKKTQDSFRSFAFCLLKNFASVYVHHIIVEQSALNQKLKSENRGSKDNTTRLKVYFTLEDGQPLLARFDLSHKGVPFLHINLENENEEVNGFNHCKLSLTEVEDNILRPLEEALMTFNYEGVDFKHAPTDFDKKMFHRVALERALFSACCVEWGTAFFSTECEKRGMAPYDWDKDYHDKLSPEVQSFINDSRLVLANEVASYEFDPKKLSHTEIFECVYDEIIGKN